jgi:hypothetical protein
MAKNPNDPLNEGRTIEIDTLNWVLRIMPTARVRFKIAKKTNRFLLFLFLSVVFAMQPFSSTFSRA